MEVSAVAMKIKVAAVTHRYKLNHWAQYITYCFYGSFLLGSKLRPIPESALNMPFSPAKTYFGNYYLIRQEIEYSYPVTVLKRSGIGVFYFFESEYWGGT